MSKGVKDFLQRAYDLQHDYEELIEECKQMLIDHDQKGTPVDQRKMKRLTEIVNIYMGVPMELSGISYTQPEDSIPKPITALVDIKMKGLNN